MVPSTASVYSVKGTRAPDAHSMPCKFFIGWEGEMVERIGGRGGKRPGKDPGQRVGGRADERSVARILRGGKGKGAATRIAGAGKKPVGGWVRRPVPRKAPRSDGRGLRQMRPVKITPSYMKHAEGSALIETGNTRVLCTASVEDKVPPFLRNSGRGWVTAEYGMLPRSTHTRTAREAARGRIGGRTSEIQRLIGRSLRAVVDFEKLGERTILIDCDVIQADGGTRTAAITGAFVALSQAVQDLVRRLELRESAILEPVAAVSVGMVGGRVMVDLAYEEDSTAEVDMNIVMTGSGRFIEVQGTAERTPFTRAQMDRMMALAAERLKEICAVQKEALARVGVVLPGRRG